MGRLLRRLAASLLLSATAGVLLWYVGLPLSMRRTVESGKATIVEVRQLDQLYPDARHFVSYLTGTHGPPTWNTVVVLYGRYELTMQVPVQLNRLHNGITSHGQPTFYLMEMATAGPYVTAASDVTHGRVYRTFGPAEWKRVVDAGGYFGVLGVTLDRDHPVPPSSATKASGAD